MPLPLRERYERCTVPKGTPFYTDGPGIGTAEALHRSAQSSKRWPYPSMASGGFCATRTLRLPRASCCTSARHGSSRKRRPMRRTTRAASRQSRFPDRHSMPCSLISPRHFEVLRIRARLIVHVDPPLEDGHALVLEDASPNPNDIRLRVLDCDDRDGSTDTAEIESETFLGIHKVALIHADGMKLVDVEEPAMAAGNGGGPHPSRCRTWPLPHRWVAEARCSAPMDPVPARHRRPPRPGPRLQPPPAPAPGDAAPAAPSIGYGLLDAPEVAVLGKDFVVTVGLSETFKEGVADTALPRPPGVGHGIHAPGAAPDRYRGVRGPAGIELDRRAEGQR